MSPTFRSAAFVFLFFVISVPLVDSQSQPQVSGTAASSVLRSSLAALVGNTAISDVTLSGSVHRILGATDEFGSVTYKVLSTGAARFDFSYSAGTTSEVRSASISNPSGFCVRPDGSEQAVPQHNLWANAASFPAFTLGPLLASSNSVITLIGEETKNERAVYHVAVSQQFTGTAAALLQHLSQMDLYLDTSSFLPVAIDFNMHPDNDALVDLPVEIQFSDYRAFSGAQVPFHVQRLLNNNLVLDIQFQTMITNSGLSGRSLGLQ